MSENTALLTEEPINDTVKELVENGKMSKEIL